MDYRGNSVSRRDMDSFGFEQGQTTGSCEYVYESSCYNKGEEFLYHFRDCQRLGKDSVAWNGPKKKLHVCRKQYLCVTRSSIGRLQHPRRNEEITSNTKTGK
jgi:hypothetical protein